MLRLAVQDSLLPGADLVEKMRTAARLGFDAVEVRAAEALASPEALRRAIGQLPLRVCGICTSPQQDPVVEEREVREARLATWRALIPIAADLGAQGIIMVPIRRPHRLPDLNPLYSSAELELALLYRILEDLLPRAEQAGVALWLEPLNFYEAMLVPNISKAVEICRQISSPALRLMADTFHMNIMEPDPMASLREAVPYLGHIHLSDSNRQLPGLGHIRFRDLFATLNAIGYEGCAAIEAIVPPDPERALAASLHLLRQELASAAG
jgi:sugar phosphate isomerase/epimerase